MDWSGFDFDLEAILLDFAELGDVGWLLKQQMELEESEASDPFTKGGKLCIS